MNLFIKTASIIDLIPKEARAEYIRERDIEIIEAFKVHKSPTPTMKALNNRYSREVIRRVATRVGLWNATARERSISDRCKHVDYSKSLYNKKSKAFKNEKEFQSFIQSHLHKIGFPCTAEVLVPGFQGRADFVGKDFVIEAKNTVSNDELCRGLGQCIVYRSCFPGTKVCVVYPDDLNHRPSFNAIFANNGISLFPFSHLEKWLV